MIATINIAKNKGTNIKVNKEATYSLITQRKLYTIACMTTNSINPISFSRIKLQVKLLLMHNNTNLSQLHNRLISTRKNTLKMKSIIYTLLSCILGTGAIVAQDYKEIKRKQDSIYQVNIKKSRIAGVYIPKDLDDAFKELNELSTDEAKRSFRNAKEEIVAKKLHFGLGNWMRVNWNFDEGSRIVKVLRGYGIFDPDDMVNFMLRSYHRHLNGEDQDIKRRVEEYQVKRKKIFEERKQNGEVISTETKPIPKGSN